MGKKYIVELGRCERLYKAYINGNGKPNITWLSPEVDLTPYTEPDLEQVRKEAYQKGYETGYEDGYNEPGKNQQEAYQRGLNDAWEAVRKIIHMPEGDLLNIFTECYSAVCTALQVILKYDAPEAIEKIRQYEQRQEEQIQVGDEVERILNGEVDSKAVFLEDNEGYYRCLFWTGCCFTTLSYPKEQFRKTGRHFDEIASVLEKMRGEQDG